MKALFFAIFATLFLLASSEDKADGKDGMNNMMVGNNFSDHPCRRTCHPGGKPMVCNYELNFGWYTTMSRACFYCPNKLSDCDRPGCILGSGTQKPVVVANRVLPGPSIEVCLGDRIRVTVNNMMQNGETVTIHWHGMHQNGTQYMDGVEMLTQCPVIPDTYFTYDFPADQTGTYFWHSHVGTQRADGLAGPLIIREPKDPHRKLYDRDDIRPVMAQDWMPDNTALTHFSNFHYGSADFRMPQILVNGRWPTKGLTDKANLTLPPFPVPVPPYVYHLNPKMRYRFRLISNAFFDTPMKFEITGHNMVVIASDGFSIKPVVTKTLTMMPAERYDVIPYFTGKQKSRSGVYYLKVSAVGASADIPTANAFAKIVYDAGKNPHRSTAEEATLGATKRVYKDINFASYEEYENDPKSVLKASQLKSVTSRPSVEGEPDVQLFIDFDFFPVKDPSLEPLNNVRVSPEFPPVLVSPRFNHITFVDPPVPLLSQWDEMPKDMLCNARHRSKKCAPDQYEGCACTHLEAIPKGALVEMFFIDSGTFNTGHDLTHPMHLHGYHFRVVASDAVHSNLTAEDVLKLDRKGLIKRNLKNAPLKDTVGVPTGGYVIVRFWADNPGQWFFHCHIDFHMMMGMAMVLRVGKQSDLPPVPPNFPRCSSWSAPRHPTYMPMHQHGPQTKKEHGPVIHQREEKIKTNEKPSKKKIITKKTKKGHNVSDENAS